MNIVRIAATVCLTAWAAGCNERPATVPAPQTPAEYFKKRQAATVTPNGRIVTDSVEAAGGAIRYRTEDGEQWRVEFTRRADGTYEYGTPTEIK